MTDRIETRTQLINFICETTDRSAIQRACHSGRVVVLGGFSPVLPHGYPGWIVTITSRFGRTWYTVVLGNNDKYKYELKIYDEFRIPWKNYIGYMTWKYAGSIYEGDQPQESRRQRDLAYDSNET